MQILTNEYFNNLMHPFDLSNENKIAVGVSGGADSLCLTLFLSQWAKENNKELIAITVNHNLREEAMNEAQEVHYFLNKKNIQHIILTNTSPIPKTGIEEYARSIRYKLLSDYCLSNNIKSLFVAHHLIDQAETFFMRLAKKSGLRGLKGISHHTDLNNIHICRPFLSISKKMITDTLNHLKIHWFDDKMNYDETFTRVRWRQALPFLAQYDISPDNIYQVTQRLARADSCLEQYTHEFINHHVWIDFRGFCRISNTPFNHLHSEIKIRVLEYLIRLIGQSGKSVSLKSVEDLSQRLPCSATIGECVFVPHKTGLYIAKEYVTQENGRFIEAHTPTRWDRFMITSNQPCFVQASPPEIKIENIPIIVQKTFPAVFIQKELEKKIQIDYKKKNDRIVQIHFLTQIEGYNLE